jgi:hypothetical protein
MDQRVRDACSIVYQYTSQEDILNTFKDNVRILQQAENITNKKIHDYADPVDLTRSDHDDDEYSADVIGTTVSEMLVYGSGIVGGYLAYTYGMPSLNGIPIVLTSAMHMWNTAMKKTGWTNASIKVPSYKTAVIAGGIGLVGGVGYKLTGSTMITTPVKMLWRNTSNYLYDSATTLYRKATGTNVMYGPKPQTVGSYNATNQTHAEPFATLGKQPTSSIVRPKTTFNQTNQSSNDLFGTFTQSDLNKTPNPNFNTSDKTSFNDSARYNSFWNARLNAGKNPQSDFTFGGDNNKKIIPIPQETQNRWAAYLLSIAGTALTTTIAAGLYGFVMSPIGIV